MGDGSTGCIVEGMLFTCQFADVAQLACNIISSRVVRILPTRLN